MEDFTSRDCDVSNFASTYSNLMFLSVHDFPSVKEQECREASALFSKDCCTLLMSKYFDLVLKPCQLPRFLQIKQYLKSQTSCLIEILNYCR